ncbi:MAG: SCP2 sterol-binding domain-containing protein [Candidatus Heimdallarchaeota archaeon]
MLKLLNTNEKFKQEHARDDFSLLLVAKGDPNAIKLKIKKGSIAFTPIPNKKETIKKEKKDCQAVIITTRPIFLALGLGKVSPIKALLTGRLKIKGLKYVRTFTSYFSFLRSN